jgi:UDP-N-acetylmuramyl pentapeptide phosphotransferase/UDP-N-acetylglucosamine-1-phosphate transferase
MSAAAPQLSSFVPGSVAMLACALCLLALLRLRPLLPLDRPNARSLHAAPTPRVGGLGIAVGCFVALVASPRPMIGTLASFLLAPAGLLVLVSLWDDYVGLSAQWRLLVHMLAASLFLVLADATHLATLPLLVLVLAGSSNLYNFMDGADGLAGGMAVFGFGAYGVLAWMAGDAELLRICVILVGAALAFLIFNFPPARLFMGDAGSVPLGFLAAAVGLLGWRRGLWPWITPLLVFSPFVVDASATLVRRALLRERIWQAHHSHYYQRLVRMGWRQRRLAMVEYALMAATASSAVLGVRHPQLQGGIVSIWVLFYMAAMWIIDRWWRGFAHAA